MENFNKEKFQLDLSNLTTYTDQISSGLAKAIILEANTLKDKLVSVQYGVVGDQYALNLLKSTPVGVSGDDCLPFSNSGTTTFAQPIVKLCSIKFEESYCINTLRKYWYDWNLSREFNTESLGTFESVFTETKMEKTAAVLDAIMWKGAKSTPKYTSTSGNLALCDGFLQYGYANSASTVNVTRSAMTVSNASVVVDSILNSVTSNATAIMDEFNLYLQPADFQNYLLALRNLNLFQYTTESRNMKEIYHPGSIGMKVTKVNALGTAGDTAAAASGTFLATKHENIWAVISSENDLSYDMFYDKLSDDLKSRMKFRMGVGFYQPELVVRSNG